MKKVMLIGIGFIGGIILEKNIKKIRNKFIIEIKIKRKEDED